MEPGRDGDIELHKGEYQDVGLSSTVGGGRGSGVGGSVGVDGTDSVGSGGGVGGGCGDSDGAGSIGGSHFWVKQWRFFGGDGTGWFQTGVMVWLEGGFVVLE